jgi:hypothetical protein
MMKVKATDFRIMLNESVLFSDTEVDEIVSTCKKNRTVDGIVSACDELQIKLDGAGIAQIIQMGFCL